MRYVWAITAILVISALGAVAYFFSEPPPKVVLPGMSSSATPLSRATPSPTLLPTPVPSPASGTVVLLEVPFISQAPFGEWSDPRQQDGCEEASLLMAMHWVRGTSTTLEQALADMHAVGDFEQTRFGTWHDLSVDGVATLAREYYRHEAVQARHGIRMSDIKDALAGGNVVIVPVNGRLLNNPHFTPPGPEYHMLVVKGFDDARQEFITNDPGMKTLGKSYRYGYDVLFGAIRDYETGYHEPITQIVKSMVVVSKR